MKGGSFPLLALLAVLALAVSSPDAVHTTSIAISPSPQPDVQEASHLDSAPSKVSDGGSSEEVPTEDDLVAELNDLTGSNVTWSNGSYSDASASSSNDVTTLTDQEHYKHLKGWYRVDVRLGLEGTHVGTFAGERLYHRIYEVLKHCKQGGSMDDCSIRNVVYKDSQGNYQTASTLYMDVQHSYFNPNVPELEDLGYRMMARAFQEMTEVPKNCRSVTFDGTSGGSRAMKFCTVASKALIAFPINGGPIQLVLKVKLEWDGKTDKGTYTCDDLSNEGVRDYVSRPFVKGFKEEIAKIEGWKENRVAPYTGCYWDHCFNTIAGRDLMEWQEVKDCEPQWNPIGCNPDTETRKNPALNCPPVYLGTRSYTNGKLNERNDPDWM